MDSVRIQYKYSWSFSSCLHPVEGRVAHLSYYQTPGKLAKCLKFMALLYEGLCISSVGYNLYYGFFAYFRTVVNKARRKCAKLFLERVREGADGHISSCHVCNQALGQFSEY